MIRSVVENMFSLSFTVTRRISLAVLLTGLLALSAFGQQTTTGNLNVTVTDPSGAVVTGATLTLVNNETGLTRTAVSGTAGSFDFETLQPAKYSITVEAKGFKKSLSTDINVSVSQTTNVTIPLEIGVQGETVTVTASQDIINSTSPTLT